MTTALEGGEGSASRPGHSLPPGKTRYPLYRRLGGPQGWSGQVQKISPPPGFDSRTVQPVASRYTDWAIPAPCLRIDPFLRSWSYSPSLVEFEVHYRVNNSSPMVFILCQIMKLFPISCGIRGALSCEQQLANGLYPVPDYEVVPYLLWNSNCIIVWKTTRQWFYPVPD